MVTLTQLEYTLKVSNLGAGSLLLCSPVAPPSPVVTQQSEQSLRHKSDKPLTLSPPVLLGFTRNAGGSPHKAICLQCVLVVM